MPTTKLILGDCLELLKDFDDNSIDAVVTDPPAGIGFMGKEWDDFRRQRNEKDAGRDSAFGRLSKKAPEYGRRSRDHFVTWLTTVMVEVLRVLKPGGHALVWAIPRTSHWTATALEDAGFEVRDRVSHLFGTGFPKSHGVSKAIDKAAGATRKVIGPPPYTRGRPTQSYSSTRKVSWDCQPGNVTAPATDEAKQWEGWGTALKPACEDWWLVRKPLISTVAANVLEHGTGALNIDACRLGERERKDYGLKNAKRTHGNTYAEPSATADFDAGKGRWPAHVVLDEEAAELLDEQSGTSKSTKGKPRKGKAGEGYGMTHTGAEYNDVGGAARFFYCAKAPKKDRGEGNTHPTVKNTKLMSWLVKLITPPGGTVLDPFMGSGSTGVACVREGFSFMGIEQNQEYFDIAKHRIGDE